MLFQRQQKQLNVNLSRHVSMQKFIQKNVSQMLQAGFLTNVAQPCSFQSQARLPIKVKIEANYIETKNSWIRKNRVGKEIYSSIKGPIAHFWIAEAEEVLGRKKWYAKKQLFLRTICTALSAFFFVLMFYGSGKFLGSLLLFSLENLALVFVFFQDHSRSRGVDPQNRRSPLYCVAFFKYQVHYLQSFFIGNLRILAHSRAAAHQL